MPTSETTNDLSLTQNITEPTFVNADSTSLNVLDLLLTDERSRVSEINLKSPLAKADQGHKTITFSLHCAHDLSIRFNSRKLDYKRGNYTRLNDEIAQVNWRALFEKSNVEEAYDIFLNKYESLCSTHIPQRKTVRTSKPCWLNKVVETSIKQNRDLWHANQRTKWKCARLISQYKSARNESAKLINQSVKKYEMSLAGDKRNPKRLF